MLALELTSHSETSGVYIETLEGSIVLKGLKDPGIDYFLNKMCKILTIPVPDIRIVKWNEKEFKKILYYLEKATFTNKDLV